jgi:ribonucleotide monophosphatase NagD (HAD superfamily)
MLKAKKLFLLDLDGTIYLDECLFPCTLPFLGAVRANGARAMYLTNNSSKSVDAYLEKFARLGIPATADDFVTSTDATIRHIEAHESETLFYVLAVYAGSSGVRKTGYLIPCALFSWLMGGIAAAWVWPLAA